MQEELFNKYQEVQEKIKAIKEEATLVAKNILSEGTTDYFNKYSHLVKGIVWTQYTPFFNDGDECIFSVNTPYLVPVIKDVFVNEEDEGEDSYADWEETDFTHKIDLEALEKNLADALDYEANPEEYTRKKVESHKTYSGYYKTVNAQSIRFYKPYKSSEQLLETSEIYKQYPENFTKDSEELLDFIENLDSDVMKELFGDHVKIIITKDNMFIEEYGHE